jgi:hypothetical protein
MAALCRFFDTDGDGQVDGPEILRGFFKMQQVRPFFFSALSREFLSCKRES